MRKVPMLRVWLTGFVAALVVGAAVTNGMAESDTDGDPSPLELFDQRIMPIFLPRRPFISSSLMLTMSCPSNKISPLTIREVAELTLSVAMFCFAVHGILRPDSLFRADRCGPEPL